MRYHVLGVPTALGGHLAGMEQTPGQLRRMGLVARLEDALRAADPSAVLDDDGDVPVEPGFREDPEGLPVRNRELIAEMLPRVADRASTLVSSPDDRLILIGGDCTAHAGALAGLRRSGSQARTRTLGLCWFDAHGDFNVPETSPSGNVWGMPFALICGRGDRKLVAAAGGPTVVEEHAALLGGQVLDELESRMLASSRVAHFGAGMLQTHAGRAALAAWSASVAHVIDGWHVAIDMDCLDGSAGWSVQMPESNGLALAPAIAAVEIVAASGVPVVGFGATGVNLAAGDREMTLDALVRLAVAAFRT